MKDKEIKKFVKESYAKIAQQNNSCCTPASSCCGDFAENISKEMGYSEKEINSVPEGANLGLGCGNPVALASLKKGDIVLDLGSGAGFDSFLAAKEIGNEGKVIGVDMTPEMIEKARNNAKIGDIKNVEFRLGEIENLPVADESVDVVISNCVINLSTDKSRVFKETFRVLKPEGRIMISDIVLLKKLPEFIKENVEAYVGCLSGAMIKNEYLKLIKNAGFEDVEIIQEDNFPVEHLINDPTVSAIIEKMKMPSEKITDIGNSVVSIKIKGIKQKFEKT